MSRFIDSRRDNKHKSAVNRQRFMRRYRRQIKQAVNDAIAKRSITDMDVGEEIHIPNKDLQEPRFQYGKGGKREIILPGNQEFVVGDKLKRPSGGAKGTGSKANNKGEGIDDFAFNVSRDEFLDMFFNDLALPDLEKTKLANITTMHPVRAGYTSEGVPANINVIRSLRSALCRRLILSAPYKSQLTDIENQLCKIKEQSPDNCDHIDDLLKEKHRLEDKLNTIPFIDTFDLRYNNRIQQPKPTTQAVMFCLMDVSGSMDEVKKDIAKRFYILLYLFLQRNYEKIEIVFIRHHTSAKEVDEQAFFYSRETGGTVVSSALELMHSILTARYPTSDWNIYAAQASDGDNWNADSPCCQKLLNDQILPLVQYFAYIEIMPRHHQSLWEAYTGLIESNKNFAMQNIDNSTDIYPVFRDLFKRQTI